MKTSGSELLEDKIITKTIQFAKDKMKNLPPSHGWDHVERVVKISEKIAKAEKASTFIVRLSAILHDIAREEEDKNIGKICHAELGSKIAYDFLMAQMLDESFANKVAHCIITHRFRNNHEPSSKEAKALYDADKLDSIGAIGIGRAFLFAGEVGAKLHNGGVVIEKTKSYTIEDTAYREYIVKLQHLHEKMLTDEGKRMAQDRHDFMEKYFKRLQAETGGIV